MNSIYVLKVAEWPPTASEVTEVKFLTIVRFSKIDIFGQDYSVSTELPFDRISFQTVASELYVVYIEWHQE